MSAAEQAELGQAFEALEHPSFAARLANTIGRPIEEVLRYLPQHWHDRVHAAAEMAIGKTFLVALDSLDARAGRRGHAALHRLAVVTTGSLGGYFGLPALMIELPVTTLIMLRSIADIARSHGEDLSSAGARFACLEVFALGGRSGEDRYAEIGYYEVRLALALHFTPLTSQLAKAGTGVTSLPGAVDLVRGIAARFGVVITDKAAAQMVPIMGALTGAAINTLFLKHFQDIARGHFTIRRLERKYGATVVEAAYRAAARAATAQGAPAAAGAVEQLTAAAAPV
ncbi:MAG: EcsC family protein [Defluviicoccus sp.]